MDPFFILVEQMYCCSCSEAFKRFTWPILLYWQFASASYPKSATRAHLQPQLKCLILFQQSWHEYIQKCLIHIHYIFIVEFLVSILCILLFAYCILWFEISMADWYALQRLVKKLAWCCKSHWWLSAWSHIERTSHAGSMDIVYDNILSYVDFTAILYNDHWIISSSLYLIYLNLESICRLLAN